MKKILSMLLVCALMLASVFCLAACGEEPAPGTEGGDTTPTTTAPASPFPAALTNVEAMLISQLNLEYTGWQFAGGMVNGVEMDETTAQSVLDIFGGSIQFVFQNAGYCNMLNGENLLEGTYTEVADGYFLDIACSGDNNYYGAFTMVEEEPVLILVNKKDSATALYMTMISET